MVRKKISTICLYCEIIMDVIIWGGGHRFAHIHSHSHIQHAREEVRFMHKHTRTRRRRSVMLKFQSILPTICNNVRRQESSSPMEYGQLEMYIASCTCEMVENETKFREWLSGKKMSVLGFGEIGRRRIFEHTTPPIIRGRISSAST